MRQKGEETEEVFHSERGKCEKENRRQRDSQQRWMTAVWHKMFVSLIMCKTHKDLCMEAVRRTNVFTKERDIKRGVAPDISARLEGI